MTWLYGKPVSPLTRRNPNWVGGLSGPACLPLTRNAVEALRHENKHIPIVAGNGIRTWDDVQKLHTAGADACFLGSLAVVRPWRMRSIIKYSNKLFA